MKAFPVSTWASRAHVSAPRVSSTDGRTLNAADSTTPRTGLPLVILLAFGVASGAWSSSASADVHSQPDVATTAEDTDVEVEVLANDSQEFPCPGGPCEVVFDIGSVTQPANGTVEISHRGGRFRPDFVTYTPHPDFSGTDTFTYTALDSEGTEGAPATVTITVTPVNDAPNAVNDTATTNEDNAVTIAVLANDTDVDEGDVLSVTSLTQPAHGTATLAGNAVTYTPNADFSGTDHFTYKAQDASGATSSSATVTITVTPVNDAPNAVNDTATTKEGDAVTIAVLANDTDVDDSDVAKRHLADPARAWHGHPGRQAG